MPLRVGRSELRLRFACRPRPSEAPPRCRKVDKRACSKQKCHRFPIKLHIMRTNRYLTDFLANKKPQIHTLLKTVHMRHRVPFGYTKILLASPVFSLSIALEKSFIAMRSVITGCKSSFPAFSNAVI